MMKNTWDLGRWFTFIALGGAGLLGVREASALTVAFLLDSITYSNTTVPYGITTGNGLIAWTYNAGDFQNGAGKYVFVNLPPHTVPPSAGYGPVYTVDAGMTTGTITQNVDTYWYDFAINYSPALSGPNSTAAITSGSYDLYVANPNTGINGNVLGQIIGGTVTPYKPALSVQISSTNAVVSWTTNYADGFVLESTASLKSGNLWTTSAIPVNVLGSNYVATNRLVNGPTVFFRLSR
jgi:hypothetical protein